MIDTIKTLLQVETGEYRGIGRQMVDLADEVVLPDGVDPSVRNNDLGIIGRYLGASSIEMARGTDLKLSSPVEDGRVVDKRVLAWLLIGRQQGNTELASDRFVFASQAILERAIRVTDAVSQLDILKGGRSSATDWRSLFEGLVKADIFGAGFEPAIVTSLGGYDGKVPLAAPFNIVPGLELARSLREEGYGTDTIVTSAARYGIVCNGLNPVGADTNWDVTRQAYRSLVGRFYPELEGSIQYETLSPSGLDAYPEELIDAARACCNQDKSLRATAEQYGAGPEAFVEYMLSHIQAFRDFQPIAESPFVIKVGAPSELRFSRWQKQVMERALPELEGFVPNTNLTKRNGDTVYGQISLYYPRLGDKPPYYPDSDSADYPEPSLGEAVPSNYWDFLYSIPEANPGLTRYDRLQQALELTSIKPDEYLALFAGEPQ